MLATILISSIIGACSAPQQRGIAHCPSGGKVTVDTTDFSITISGDTAVTATYRRLGYLQIGSAPTGPPVLVDFRFSGALLIDDIPVDPAVPVLMEQGRRIWYTLVATLGPGGGTATAAILGMTGWVADHYGQPGSDYGSGAHIVPIPEPGGLAGVALFALVCWRKRWAKRICSRLE